MAARIEQPLERAPVELDARRMSPARRARIIARDGGACRYPGCESRDRLEVDHIVCLALGGKDADANLETLCAEHHQQKTRRDVRMIAKARRLDLAHRGLKPPPTQKIKSRGFPKRWRDA